MRRLPKWHLQLAHEDYCLVNIKSVALAMWSCRSRILMLRLIGPVKTTFQCKNKNLPPFLEAWIFALNLTYMREILLYDLQMALTWCSLVSVIRIYMQMTSARPIYDLIFIPFITFDIQPLTLHSITFSLLGVVGRRCADILLSGCGIRRFDGHGELQSIQQ